MYEQLHDIFDLVHKHTAIISEISFKRQPHDDVQPHDVIEPMSLEAYCNCVNYLDLLVRKITKHIVKHAIITTVFYRKQRGLLNKNIARCNREMCRQLLPNIVCISCCQHKECD